ncbi:MAG: Gfo/Idh/MocA family oxidoreductase [Eubacteriales bacterium]
MGKIRLGIIGIGNMGTGHAINILDGKCSDFVITAVADKKPQRLDWAKEKIEGVSIFVDGMELLDSGLVDAVLVAIPHYDHPTFAIEAMKRKIHVMCEKPAGVYTKQVMEMNQVAEECDVVFAMMFNQRTNPLYLKMRELVQSGIYGEIKRVNWIITTWFRTQYYYDSGDWRATWAGEGGGVLLNQCPHQLDLLQWICGMPCKVLAKLHYGKWHNIEVEDDVTAYLEYPNGATGVFITSTGDAHGTNRFEVQLDRAKIVVDGDKIEVLEYEESTKEFLNTSKEGFASPKANVVEVDIDTDRPKDHVGVMIAFGNKILGKGELIARGEEGIYGLTLSNAMHLSSFLNQEIDLPFDENLYYKELMKRVENSKEKEVVEVVVADLSKSF